MPPRFALLITITLSHKGQVLVDVCVGDVVTCGGVILGIGGCSSSLDDDSTGGVGSTNGGRGSSTSCAAAGANGGCGSSVSCGAAGADHRPKKKAAISVASHTSTTRVRTATSGILTD
jgi:hypothetical protein